MTSTVTPEPVPATTEPDAASPLHRRRQITLWSLYAAATCLLALMLWVPLEDPRRHAPWFAWTVGVLIVPMLVIFAVAPVRRWLGLELPAPLADERDDQIYLHASAWTLDKMIYLFPFAIIGVIMLPGVGNLVASTILVTNVALFAAQNLRSRYLRQHM